MNIDFNSNKLIILWYPAYASGKFIMGCLSLSKHCTPMHIDACNYLLDNPDDYEYRLSTVLKTLPIKDQMKNWLDYEFNSEIFYDTSGPFNVESSVFERMHSGKLNDFGIDKRIEKSINQHMSFFAESRGNDICSLNKYLSIWPNAKIILLTNFEKFLNIAVSKKNLKHTSTKTFVDYVGNECRERYNLLKGASWPDWELFEINHYNIDKVAKHVTISNDTINDIKTYYPWHSINAPIFNIDVDGTYFNKDKFFAQIKKLYDWLGYDDFNETMLLQYYEAYIELHI